MSSMSGVHASALPYSEPTGPRAPSPHIIQTEEIRKQHTTTEEINNNPATFEALGFKSYVT